jgi:subtilisin-like proprotein convertase family protein
MNSIQQFAIGLTLATGATATLTFDESNPGLPLAIPDHNSTGILSTLTVTDLDPGTRYSVDLSLDISGTGHGGYVGDLYAHLAHQSPDGGQYLMSVLLNRPGRSDTLPNGYDDAGLNITLSDSADHDVHTYRAQADYKTNGSGALTGTWQPDRRLANPDTVTDASVRSTPTFDDLVNSLVPSNPNGYWYLFVADMQTGGTMQLNSWSLSFSEMSAIPEPGNLLTLAGLVGSALLLRSRRRKSVA